MKKNLFFMALAGAALASCVSDEVANLSQQEQEKVKISFDSPVLYNSDESRADYHGEIGNHVYAGISYSYPRNEDFVVYAVQHNDDFEGWANATEHAINEQTVTYDSSLDGWTAKTTADEYYYWPQGKMSFAASSPANLDLGSETTRSYGEDGLTIENFEIQANAANQYDLLFSKRSINQVSSDMNHLDSHYSGIPIKFQHALSSIRFSIANTSGVEVVLKGIKVYGVKYKGSFSENLTEDENDYGLYEVGDNGNVHPEWTVDDAIVPYAQGYIGFSGSIDFPEEPRYVSSLAGTGDQCNQLLLLPQELEDDAFVEVTYEVAGNEHTKTAQLNDGVDSNSNTIDEWKIGVRYTYRLVYGESTADKDKIYFSPSTEEWEEHGIIEITL